MGALTLTAQTLWGETLAKWFDARSRKSLADNLLLIVPLLMFAMAVLWRGRVWMDRLIAHAARAILGARAADLGICRLAGPDHRADAGRDRAGRGAEPEPDAGRWWAVRLRTISAQIGLTLFAAVWLGIRAFPVRGDSQGCLGDVARISGRSGGFLTTALGVVLAMAHLQQVAMQSLDIPDAANSVLSLSDHPDGGHFAGADGSADAGRVHARSPRREPGAIPAAPAGRAGQGGDCDWSGRAVAGGGRLYLGCGGAGVSGGAVLGAGGACWC